MGSRCRVSGFGFVVHSMCVVSRVWHSGFKLAVSQVYVCVCACACFHMCAEKCIFSFTYMYIRMCIHIYIYTCMYIYYIYIYTCKSWPHACYKFHHNPKPQFQNQSLAYQEQGFKRIAIEIQRNSTEILF